MTPEIFPTICMHTYILQLLLSAPLKFCCPTKARRNNQYHYTAILKFCCITAYNHFWKYSMCLTFTL